MRKAHEALNVFFFDVPQAAKSDQIVYYGTFGIISAIAAGVCMAIL